MNQDALDPAGPAEQELSAVLDRFEEAWQEGTVPNLETFLPTAVLAGSRQELLSELVKLDLEFRWRQKQSSRPDDTLIQPGKQEQETLIYDSSAAANAWLLEKYVEEYPQLGSVDQLPLALIVEEYRVRQRWGDRPSHQDYLERFAERNEDLSAALSGVDQELAAEREGTGPGQGQVSTETVTVVAGQDRKNGPGSAIGVGSVVGDYELLQEIGRGGMGVVYRARQLSLQREVALKMILPGQLADQEAVERFYSEAQIVGQLRHPNIVMVYEVAEHDGNHYFSMDYIEGDSLADLTRSLSEKAAAEYVVKIASAIQFAHEAGILHRDLKPSNILIDAGSQPLVTDFGLAKRTKEDSGLTKTGNIIGTPSYMSPEQVAIGKEDKLGPASDVYSLGAILYELLTGCPPFRSDSMLETLMQVLEREPVAPRLLAPATDRDLETITLKCLEKDPQRRYGSATELADELNRYLEGEPILARPVSGLERAWRWCKRKPALVGMWAVAVLLLLTVSIAVPAVWQSQQDADQAKKDQLAAAEQSRSEKARAAEKRLEEERKLREQQSLAEEKLATERLASLKSEAAALERFGLYSIALPVYEKMVELRDQLRTKDLRQALSEKQSLVNLYATLGRFDAMARVCETITQEIKKLPAADYAEDQLVAMNNLAYAYEMNGDFKRAREIYESTYQQLVSSLGATHPKTLVVQNNLAVCLAAMGESEKAFSLLKENIGQRKKLVTAGDVSSEFVLAPNSNLCWLYFQFGLLAKADEQYDEYFVIEDSGVAGGNKVEKLRAAATKQLVELHFDHNEKLAELLLFVESLVEADDSDFMRIQREGGPRLANIIVSTDPIMALGRSRKDTHVAIFQEPKPGQGPTGAAGPGPVLDRSFDWRPKERVVVLLPLVLPNSPTPPTIVNLPTAFAAINEKVANARQVEIEKRSLFVFGSLLDNYLKQGDLARAQGHRETATQYYEQALTLVQWLDEPQFQVGLFGAEYVWFLEEKRVDVYARLGRVDDAKACINQLIDRTHRLLELIAKNTSAEVANDASVSATEQAAEAKTFEERILRDIEEEVIYPEELEDGLVLAYVKRGDLELVEGRSDEAAVSYGKALSLSSELNLEAESYPAYLALANVSMAKIVRGRGDLETEAMLLGKAREQWKEIVDARRSPLKGCPLPSDSERLRKYLDQEIRLEQKEYFSVYCTWGELDGNVNEWWIHELERVAGIALLEMDRYKEAESFLKRSYNGYQRKIEKIPVAERVRVLFALKSLRRLYRGWNKPGKVAEIEGLMKESFQLPGYSNGLAVALFNWNDPGDHPDNLAEARAAYEERLVVLRNLVEKHPGVSRYKNELGTTLNNYGNLLLRTDQLNASKDQYEAARAIYDVTLQEKDDEDAEEFCSYHSRELVHVWLNLGRLRKAQGNLTGAVEAAAKVRELTVIEEKKDREERWMGMEASRAYCLYTAGCLVTELAQEVAKDETLALPERQKRADEYATRAVELLRDSVLQAPLYVAFRPEGGTFEDLGSDMFTEMAITIREEYVTLLKKDAALEVLRQREDFQTILKQFEEEAKKKEKDDEKPSATDKSSSP